MNDRTHILIIEDDESISLGLKLNLEAEGFSVTTVNDGDAGLEEFRTREPDLVILDIMLPKQNGFEVIQGIRGAGSRVPVIMLSALGTETDKVMGLNLGAEDYITKPFGLAELLARINAVLRRSKESTEARAAAERPLRVGELVIDPKKREVTRAGAPVELTATEFDVLWCLAAKPGTALSREDIQTRVWGPKHHGTLRTIDNFILQLRSKLEPDPTNPTHLLTVRGVGYRFGS